MVDPDFWKKEYRPFFEASSDREKRVAKEIKDKTGKEPVPTGLGAGSDEFLPGSAASRGFEKGDHDLSIEGTNIGIEVTGPLVDGISDDEDLWVRPDKIQNAINNPEVDKWVVHENGSSGGTKRVIRMDDDFLERVSNGDLKEEDRYIRGNRERYVIIPASDECVRPFDELIDHINQQ